MGTDALRLAIESEGRARIEAIRRDAEQQADRLRADAAAAASRRQERSLREREAELRLAAGERIAAARREARRRMLEARDEVLGRIFAMAEETLSDDLETAAARDELLARAEAALRHMPVGVPVVLECSRHVAPLLESALADRAGVRVTLDPEVANGFRAVGADGAVVVDATLSKLLDLDRAAIAIQLLQRLERERPETKGDVT